LRHNGHFETRSGEHDFGDAAHLANAGRAQHFADNRGGDAVIIGHQYPEIF
jgi:hypothetical protein